MVKQRQWQPMFNGMLGLKQGYSITNMPPGSVLDIKNMYLNGLGGKQSRQGYQELFHFTDNAGTTRYTTAIKSLIQYNPYGGTSEVLAYSNTTIFKRNLATKTSTSVRTGVAADVPWEWLQYRDFILGVNGKTDVSFLYSSAGAVPISVTAPTSHCTATASVGTGVADGTYSYLITFYDSTRGRESNPFTVVDTGTHVATTAAPNNQVTLSSLPTETAGEGVTHRRIYRKKTSAAAEALYYRISSDNAASAITQTTFVDTGAVTGGSNYLVYDTGAQDTGNTPHPKNATNNEYSGLICECFDRIFMEDPTDPSILIYSKIGDYWAYPTGNFFYVGRGDGSPIKRLEKIGSALLIHKGNAWYILDTDPANASAQIRLLSKIGTQDYRTSCVAHNQVVRLTPTGFYRSIPTEYSVTDLREDYIGSDIADYEKNLDWGNSNQACMYNYNAYNRRHVYYFEPVSASYYSKCFVYDIVLSQWVYFEIGTDVECVADYTYQGKKYMIFGDGYGIIWQWDLGDADGTATAETSLNGTATSAGATTLVDTTKTWTVNEFIGVNVYTRGGTGALQKRRILSNTANTLTVATWGTTPDSTTTYSIGGIDKYTEEYWDSNGDPHVWKRMRWMVPYISQTGDYEVEISFKKDFFGSYSKTTSVELVSSSSIWGTFIWGSGSWGQQSANLERIRLGGKYHFYSIRYRNDLAGQKFDWNGHGAVFQVLYDRNK